MDLFRRQGILPPEDYTLWENACSAIGTLPGLQSLKIDMTLWNYRNFQTLNTIDDGHLILILSPLKAISAKRFEIEMNAELSDHGRETLEPFSFTIIQRHRPYNTLLFRQG
jgi:hypothetical protein